MIDLSIHLITYNNEKHIEDTLQSILKQNVDFEYEIVVGDDCSTDDSLKIINQYSEKHPSLFNVKKNETQLGILKNFKTTLDRCKGAYVFDIAGDDMLKTNDALQKMVNILNKNTNLGFVDSGFDNFNEVIYKKDLKLDRLKHLNENDVKVDYIDLKKHPITHVNYYKWLPGSFIPFHNDGI